MKPTHLVAFLLAFWFDWLQGATPVPRPLPGWTMRLVLEAPAIRHPSVVCVAPDGRVFVAEDPMDISSANAHVPEGRIVCLHPDGHTTVFADRLFAVFGMQYLEGKLYVLHNPRFSVFTDDQGVGRDRSELIEQTNPEPWALDWNDHVPANFRLAMDGYFYVATGDKGLYGAVDRSGRRVDLHGGGVFRIRPDGTGLEVFSTGVRNILDVAINDEDELFTYDNTDEHDWMGRLTHMVDGGFYGYPFDFAPRRPYTLWMLADYGPGAATGALAWNNASLPPSYRSNLILADFGQRNLRRVRLERAGATCRAVENELLFLDPPPDFRPVGITETPDGSGFYICDWQHADNKESVTIGRLWLLTADFATNGLPQPERYAPVVAAALGKPTEGAVADLIEGLSHPQKWMRLAAQRALTRRGAEALPALVKVLKDEQGASFARAHALWALDAIDSGEAARNWILSLAGASPERGDASLIRQAIRQLGQLAGPEALSAFTTQLKSPDASFRLQAANALRRVNHAAAVPALLDALGESDAFARYVVFTALNRLARAHPAAWSLIVRALDQPAPLAREAASFALRDTYDADLAQVLAGAARDPSRPASTRATALQLLAGIHQQPPAWKGEWWAYHPALGQPPAKTAKWAGTEVVTAALRAGLEDEEATVRLAAVNGLRAVNERESAARLRTRFARESAPDVRRAILETLGDFSDLETLPVVTAALLARPLDPALLPAALVVAGKLGGASGAPADALPPLARGITNLPPAALDTSDLRVAALDALGRLRLADSTVWLARYAASGEAPERGAALDALIRLGGSEALTALRPLLGSGSPEARRAAVAATGRLKSRAALDDLLAAYRNEITREAAVAALTELPDLRALDAYLGGLASPAAALRDKCRAALATLSKEAWPLIQARPDAITPVALQELRRVYAKDTNILASPFFARSAAAPEPAEFEQFALANSGDAWRGQKLFFDPQGVACIKCHLVAGWGGTVGPDLTTIGAQFGRAALIESVLYPSKTVREGYQQYIVETTDDESFNGAIKNESADTLTLVDVEGRLHPIPKARIKSRRSSALSLMPEGLHAGLKLEQFTDLLAYVESLREDPRRPGTKPPPPGFESLFNGRDMTGWKPSLHWQAKDGLLEHDGVADDIWSTRDLVNFELRLEWRWPDQPHFEDHPVINAEGYELKGADGKPVRERVLEAGDSGVFFRGLYKAQANLFCYPIGSGEFWEYRESLAGDERRAVTPSRRADRPIGQWNDMWITVREDHVTILVNGQEVIRQARLPGLPARGPIGFQHEHGRLQLQNIFVRELAR